MVLGVTVGDERGFLAPDAAPLGFRVRSTELDRGGVVVQLGKGKGEPLLRGDHHLGGERGPVGIEEAVQRPAHRVVGERVGLPPAETEALRRERRDRLRQPVDRLPLACYGAHQHPDGLGVGQAAAPVGGGDGGIDQFGQPEY